MGQKRHPDLFDRLTDADRRMLMAAGERRHVLRGAQIYEQESCISRLFVVVAGLIHVYYVSASGQMITFAYWGPGTLVGNPGLAGEFYHLWSARAAQDTELLRFDRQRFIGLMERSPCLAAAVIEALEHKAKRLGFLVQLLATTSVPERLRLTLLNLIDLHGETTATGVRIDLRLSHEALAQMIGASRQWVCVAIGRLQREGLIAIESGTITVLRPDSLRLQGGGAEWRVPPVAADGDRGGAGWPRPALGYDAT
jgi:CRP/FNR family transcriptional regulator, cyclic AMP receptor protein